MKDNFKLTIKNVLVTKILRNFLRISRIKHDQIWTGTPKILSLKNKTNQREKKIRNSTEIDLCM